MARRRGYPPPRTRNSSRNAEKSSGFSRTRFGSEIAALREYVIVAHGEPRIEVFRRTDDGGWSKGEEARAGGRVRLASIACELDVGEVYRDPFAGS